MNEAMRTEEINNFFKIVIAEDPNLYLIEVERETEYLIIGKPTEHFWDRWREAKRLRRFSGKNTGAMMKFRAIWGMSKDHDNNLDNLEKAFMIQHFGSVASWRPIRRDEKEALRKHPWFIAFKKRDSLIYCKRCDGTGRIAFFKDIRVDCVSCNGIGVIGLGEYNHGC